MNADRVDNVDRVEESSSGESVKSCSVCHSTAGKMGRWSGVAMVCMSCNSFFRRQAKVMLPNLCKHGNRCQITADNRKCQSCRLAECLKIGMVLSTREVTHEDLDSDQQDVAEDPIIQAQQPPFGPNTRCKLRSIFVGVEGDNCISIEEHRVAMMENEYRMDQKRNNNALSFVEKKNESDNESDARLTMMAQQLCLEARALFSETIHLTSDNTSILKVDVETKTMASDPSSNMDVFPVYCDPVNIVKQVPARIRSTSHGNVVYDAEKENDDIPKEEGQELEKGKKESSVIDDYTLPSNNLYVDFDDSIVAGSNIRPALTILTSTPSHSFVDVEGFFGNTKSTEQKPMNDEKFQLPNAPTALMRMMRRRTVGPKEVVEEMKEEEEDASE